MIKHLWTVFMYVLFFASAASAQKKTVLSPTSFEEQIRIPDVQLLDVRTMDEYSAGHIRNSLQADWLNAVEFKDRVQHLDPRKPVYVYCASGTRSSDAAKLLRKQGFQVYELQSGIAAWSRGNLPIERDSARSQMTTSQYQELVGSASTVLVDFGAKWCPPCKKMEPVLEKLQADANGAFLLTKVDAGVHTEIMNKLRVGSIPCFILYKNGKEVWRKEGLVTLEEFKSKIH